MTDRKSHDAFDPVAPIGEPTVDDTRTDGPPAEDLDDIRIVELLNRATEAPGDLKLDWNRLESRLADEPVIIKFTPPAGQPRKPWVRTLSIWASLSAAAAVAIVSTVVLLHHRDTSQPPVANVPAPAPEVVAHVNVDPQEAAAIIDEPAPRGNAGEIRVVYPRRTGTAGFTSPQTGKFNGPMVFTDRDVPAGTPYVNQPGETDDFLMY